MDVIFLNSGPSDEENWYFFSRYIGPYKIAHWLRRHGHTAQVIDYITHMTYEQLDNAVRKFITGETRILAISTTFLVGPKRYHWSNGQTGMFPEHLINVIEDLKVDYPKLKIVLGGYGSDSAYMKGLPDATIMSYTSASEDIFLEYLESLKTPGAPRPMARMQESFIGTPQAPRPRPIFEQARNIRYNIETDDFRFSPQDVILPGEPLPLDVSRGCIFACRFCQYPHLGKHKLDYVRGMDYIKEELLYNYENFGTTHYMILDDTFNDTEWKMSNFYNMTQSLPFKIDYAAYLRADLIDRFPDTAHMLKESGLWGAYHGLESLHPSASMLVGKGWSGKRARDFIPHLYHDLWKGQVPQHLNFIVGLPKETKRDLRLTVKWYLDNKLYSTNFKSLNLNGPENAHSNRTILSEFDRNAEKYGFSFIDMPVKNPRPGAVKSIQKWRNETWNQEEAIQFEQRLNRFILPNRRTPVWSLGSMQFLGYDRDYIMNTPMAEMSYTEISTREEAKFQEYYKQLMEL